MQRDPFYKHLLDFAINHVLRDLKHHARIPIPGHTLVRLNPTSYHLVISGARPMKAGTEITLTLVFAHDGSYQIPAEVTNPQTGGASYFLN